MLKIDRSFDFRNEIRPGSDPDKYSMTLRSYHKLLWSKELPNGELLQLSDSIPGKYLHHKSPIGDFNLTSDQIYSSFILSKRMHSIVSLVEEDELEFVQSQFHTIGGFMVFPGNKIDNKMTINCSRGLNARIIDRFDLTLECIRRHYLGLDSPLSDTIGRYGAFFALFGNFKQYVEYFLLQDLVNDDFSQVNFFLPFDSSFPTHPFPRSIDEYKMHISNTLDFVNSRGVRMEQFSLSTHVLE